MRGETVEHFAFIKPTKWIFDLWAIGLALVAYFILFFGMTFSYFFDLFSEEYWNWAVSLSFQETWCGSALMAIIGIVLAVIAVRFRLHGLGTHSEAGEIVQSKRRHIIYIGIALMAGALNMLFLFHLSTGLGLL